MDNINKWIINNKENILKKLSELIQIKTINYGSNGNEKPGQEYIYDFISKFLPEKDIDLFEIDDIEGARENSMFNGEIDGIERNYKNRPNLVAKIDGSGGGKSILFSGHIDVVPVMEEEWITFKDPFSGKIKDGKMYGRGSNDMKAGTISGFFALKCLKDLNINLKGNVYAESVVDEELGGVNGTIVSRLRYPNIDFSILSENTGLKIGVETCGGSVWKAIFSEKGPGGYSQSTNPIHKISEFVFFLEEFNEYRNRKEIYPNNFHGEKYSKLLELLIYAGGKNYIENASYIPKIGKLYFLIQTRPNVPESALWEDFIKFLEKKAQKSKYMKNDFPKFKKVVRYFNGHSTDLNHSGINALKNAYSDLNLDYREESLNYICDAQAFKEIGNTEVVVLGPSGDNFHGIDEYVDIESIFKLIKVMVVTAIKYCS